jgi:hypothetical protein
MGKVLTSERVNVGLPRKQEIQETDPPPFAGFANAQKNKILAQPLFCDHPFDDIAKFGKCSYGILSVVIVSGNVIVLQESEKLIAIL